MEQKLSPKSTKFIEDLRLYLFSSGKKDTEINDIIHELEDHLYEAESKGKSIEQIIGSSPKDYMHSISKEMRTDYKEWAKYIPLVIVGSMSYIVFRDLLSGTLSYGILTIIGCLIYSLLFFAGFMAALRYTTSRQVSRMKEALILSLPFILSTLFIGGILLMDLLYPSPLIHFGTIGSVIVGILFLGFIIFFSIWAKTAILPMTLLALYLPEFALSLTSLDEIVRTVISMVITYMIIGIYLLLELKREKVKIQ
ncbi:HAAS domain-containing protein [Pradoshia sp.]